jgi:hypothetical protein
VVQPLAEAVGVPGLEVAEGVRSPSIWLSGEVVYRPVVWAMKNQRAITSRSRGRSTPKSRRPTSHNAYV